MAYKTSVGTGFFISQTFASAKNITVLSNANPALATSVGHGYTDGDELLYLGGWEAANNGVYRADQQSVDTLLLTGLNTTNTNRFPTGSGLGTLQKISTWIELPQVTEITTSGGTPRYIDVQPIKLQQGIKLPNGFDPASISFTMGFDNTLSNWNTLLDISRGGVLVAYKSVKDSGAATYGYGFFAMTEAPQEASGSYTKAQATFSAQGPLISY